MHKRNRELKVYLEKILPMWSERDSGSPHLKSGAQNTDPAQKILIFFFGLPLHFISPFFSLFPFITNHTCSRDFDIKRRPNSSGIIRFHSESIFRHGPQSSDSEVVIAGVAY